MTMASAAEGEIWCANLFYVYDSESIGFIITSDEKTRHITLALSSSGVVAGSIVLETEEIGKIRGLQFKAEIKKVDNSISGKYRLKYLKRFPYAILNDSELWLLTIIEAKYTDNRFGFGKKLIWKR